MSKIRKSAKMQDCMIRVPEYCNFNPETVILAHKNGAGLALKSSDHEAAYACSVCHDIIDHRIKTNFTDDEILIMFYEGIFRTQLLLLEIYLITVNN